MKLYELIIDNEDTDEVFAISLVESPAIESNWVAFDKETIQFAAVDTEKKMIIGPILIPNKHILRVDGEGQPYHVTFSADTVSRLAQNYLMKKYTDQATIEHESKLKGVNLVESWIKTGKLDKSNNYGLNVPEGTWMGIMKITDDKLWKDYIKTGKILGFSIEGYFEHKLIHASSIDLKDIEDLTEEEAKGILNRIHSMIMEKYAERMGEPGIASSYPGEVASGSVAPSLK